MEKSTGVETGITVKPSFGLEEDQITDMLKASMINAEQDMQARMPKLPDLSNIQLQQSTPSLVIAYRHTGKITAESALIKRNQVSHPGFITGNVEIVNV